MEIDQSEDIILTTIQADVNDPSLVTIAHKFVDSAGGVVRFRPSRRLLETALETRNPYLGQYGSNSHKRWTKTASQSVDMRRTRAAVVKLEEQPAAPITSVLVVVKAGYDEGHPTLQGLRGVWSSTVAKSIRVKTGN
jgi:hypothetical protein